MKKTTKQKIMVAFIILTFSFSSLAFFFQPADETGKINTLESFVVEGRLDERTESVYVQNGFTSMKFFYSDSALLEYVSQLPEITSTNLGQMQLIAQKIPDNETYATITSNSGSEEIRNVTREALLSSLCRLLTITPLECGLGNVNKTG